MILISGIEDIKNKVIRAVSEKFKEDPLRVYRVARFASKLDFEVEEDTIKIMKELKEELRFLSPERVFDELRKNLDEEAQKHYEDYSEYIQLVGDLMSGNLMQNEKELTITRFDEKYISFTIETTMYEDGNHQYYNVVGKTYDVQTGEEVNLQDVVNDKDLFLQKYEDGIRFNFGDSYDYLSPNPNKYFEKLRATDGLDLTWCLNYEGITIYAYYEFSNHDLPSQVAKLYYDDAPSAYNREYFDIGDEYIFPSANTIKVDVDGDSEREVLQSELNDIDKHIHAWNISYEDKILIVENKKEDAQAYLIKKNNQYYLLTIETKAETQKASLIDLKTLTLDEDNVVEESFAGIQPLPTDAEEKTVVTNELRQLISANRIYVGENIYTINKDGKLTKRK